MKRILASLAVFGLMVGAAQAQVNKTMAVSVPPPTTAGRAA